LLRILVLLRRSGKAGVIRLLFKTFPQRRFLLVGDSGEADPEVYGAVARRYPQQLAGILIRQVETRRNSPARFQKAFRGIPAGAVRMFRDAEELACEPLVSGALHATS
jgi:hypothetical protein